jgi:PAS domain S-box-containing protein
MVRSIQQAEEERSLEPKPALCARMNAKRAAPDNTLELAVAEILAEPWGLAESLPRLLKTLCAELGWDLGEAWTAGPGHTLVQLAAVWHESPVVAGDWLRACEGLAIPPTLGLVGRVWSSGEPEWVVDLSHDESFARGPFAAQAGLNTACGFSLRADGEAAGVIALFKQESGARDDRLLKRLSALGRQIGQLARAEGKTSRSEPYFRELTEWTSDILAVLKVDGTIEYENAAVECVLGYQRPERIGRRVFDFIHPEDIAATFDVFRAGLMAPGSVQRIELRARHRDGSWIWLESVLTIRFHDSEPMAIVASRDITKRQQRQTVLTSSENRIRSIVNNTPIVLFEFDSDGVYSLSEGGALKVLGRRPGEAVGSTVARVYEDVPSIPQIAWMAISGESVSAELPVRKRWFHTTCSPLYDEDGVIIGAAGAAVDITEIKARQMFLEHQNHLLEMIALGSSGDDVLRELALTVESVFEDSVCVIWSAGNKEGHLLPLAAPSLPQAVLAKLKNGGLQFGHRSAPVLSANDGECLSVLSADISVDPLWRDIADPFLACGLVHVWCAPVLAGNGELLGAIDAYHPANRELSAADEDYLRDAVRTAHAVFQQAGASGLVVGARSKAGKPVPPGRANKPRHAPALQSRRRGKAAQHSLELTDAQARILRLIARGLSNNEIARAVGLSPHTVKEYVAIVTRRLGARNRAHAVALALDLGLV